MPDISRIPKYRHHKPSGQAVVTLSGRDIYLGKRNTKVSKAEYGRCVGEWLASGGCLPSGADLSVSELCLAYWRYAKVYCRDTRGGSRGPSGGSVPSSGCSGKTSVLAANVHEFF